MADSIIDQKTLTVLNVPVEGRLKTFGKIALPIRLNWGTAINFTLNLQNVVERNLIDCVKTLWIDNSNCAFPVTIVLSPSGQTIEFPPGLQGYVEVIAPNPLSLSFSVGSVVLLALNTTQIQLLNYGVAGMTWQSGPASLLQIVSKRFNGFFGSAQLDILAPGVFNPANQFGFLIQISCYVTFIASDGVGTVSSNAVWVNKITVAESFANWAGLPNLVTGAEVPTTTRCITLAPGQEFQLTINGAGVTAATTLDITLAGTILGSEPATPTL